MQAITQSDVARAAGVSRGLVSLALADSSRVAPETKRKILDAAKALGYTRNFGAAALASSRSTLIGVVLPNLRNPYFESLVAAIQSESESRGLTVLTATASGDERRELAMLEHFQAMRVGGIILATPSQPASRYVSLASRLPLVIAGSPYDGGPAHVVHIDEHAAADLAISHVREKGYSRIVYVTTGLDEESAAYRHSGIVAACEKAGLPLDVVEPGEGIEAIVADAQSAPGTLCAIVHNDYLAIDAVSLLRRHGLTPGRDLGIISYDNTFLAAHLGFDLTSVDQQPHIQAKQALDAIGALADEQELGGTDMVVQPKLIIRSSS